MLKTLTVRLCTVKEKFIYLALSWCHCNCLDGFLYLLSQLKSVLSIFLLMFWVACSYVFFKDVAFLSLSFLVTRKSAFLC